MNCSRLPRRAASLAVAGIALLTVPAALAGGGPENLLLVVRASDTASKSIANYYASLRGVPACNVVYSDFNGSDAHLDVEQFRGKILRPIFDEMKSRDIDGQIDCIAYSSGFPWSINVLGDIPADLRSQAPFPEASINSLTFLAQMVNAKNAPAYLNPAANGYFAHSGNDDLPSRAFRYWYGWGNNGELLEAGGDRYVLSIVLGVTFGRGNTVGEIVNYLRRSAAADGTFPKGTIYYMQNDDIRSRARSSGFQAAVAELKKLNVAAQIVPGDIPKNRPDVQGLMAGISDFDWKASGSAIRPGAICENLTSYAGLLDPGVGQTPLSVFLRYGAAGSSGPVAEPFVYAEKRSQPKFPDAMLQVHYARGCNLVESFYQSIASPYQLLIVGDPLCQPWANIPKVAVEGVTAGATVSGPLTIKPSAKLPRAGEADRFELYLDGIRIDSCAARESFQLDTAGVADGFHELRVVGVENSPVESQGRLIIPVHFNNHAKTIQFEASPRTVRAGRNIKLSANAPGAMGVAFYHYKQVIAKFQGEQGEVDVDSTTLGEGPVTLSAIGWFRGGGHNHVCSDPIELTIENGGSTRDTAGPARENAGPARESAGAARENAGPARQSAKSAP